jgi:hypothetical protein
MRVAYYDAGINDNTTICRTCQPDFSAHTDCSSIEHEPRRKVAPAGSADPARIAGGWRGPVRAAPGRIAAIAALGAVGTMGAVGTIAARADRLPPNRRGGSRLRSKVVSGRDSESVRWVRCMVPNEKERSDQCRRDSPEAASVPDAGCLVESLRLGRGHRAGLGESEPGMRRQPWRAPPLESGTPTKLKMHRRNSENTDETFRHTPKGVCELKAYAESRIDPRAESSRADRQAKQKTSKIINFVTTPHPVFVHFLFLSTS